MTFDSTTTEDQAQISSTSSESRGVEDSASEELEDIKSSPSPSLQPADCTSSSSFSSTISSSSSSDQNQSDQLETNNNSDPNRPPPNPLSTSIPNSLKANSSNTAATTTTAANHHSTNNGENRGNENCYNQVLDDEIRSRLDRLNALSDLINSLERQFDEANSLFRNTLKCSSDRLSSVAKALGTKSIRQGRVYNAAKISVEQSQSDCQRACVQFEQANKDHQIAKNTIREAELKLREIVGQTKSNGVIAIPNFSSIESIDISNLKLADSHAVSSKNQQQNSMCDRNIEVSGCSNELNETTISAEPALANNNNVPKLNSNNNIAQETNAHYKDDDGDENTSSSPNQMAKSAAQLSEELNQAIMRLVEAEKKRGQSEMLHLDRANKLMVAQENLVRLEREHGQSIRRSQIYFDEAKRFDAKLNSVKGEICRISEEILAAKQAYAQTLSELEQFSDDLHDSSSSVFK